MRWIRFYFHRFFPCCTSKHNSSRQGVEGKCLQLLNTSAKSRNTNPSAWILFTVPAEWSSVLCYKVFSVTREYEIGDGACRRIFPDLAALFSHKTGLSPLLDTCGHAGTSCFCKCSFRSGMKEQVTNNYLSLASALDNSRRWTSVRHTAARLVQLSSDMVQYPGISKKLQRTESTDARLVSGCAGCPYIDSSHYSERECNFCCFR